ncbi:hypothetical protein AVEN_52405-1 [Araneus ventricosus]|uniref:Uncharacterized protein n=1 Tax=Araneus ventricosus TaxID=182803 RepID=A0A4Y2H0P0_ARAVE|nr:hypothetical protein AVEN_52405-1 [Araneus ventricosus]
MVMKLCHIVVFINLYLRRQTARDRWRGLVIQLLRRARLSDGVRLGALSSASPCRSGVRAKHGVDMVGLGEPGPTRSSKAERTGPGRKRSRQKLPHGAVVG